MCWTFCCLSLGSVALLASVVFCSCRVACHFWAALFLRLPSFLCYVFWSFGVFEGSSCLRLSLFVCPRFSVLLFSRVLRSVVSSVWRRSLSACDQMLVIRSVCLLCVERLLRALFTLRRVDLRSVSACLASLRRFAWLLACVVSSVADPSSFMSVVISMIRRYTLFP